MNIEAKKLDLIQELLRLIMSISSTLLKLYCAKVNMTILKTISNQCL